jgi:Ku protein
LKGVFEWPRGRTGRGTCAFPSYPLRSFCTRTSEREKIRFHQINKETGNRIRYQKVDAESGDEVDQDDIIKGYEAGKGSYIELEPEELEAAAINSTRMIDIESFVPKKEIDELYMGNPYYIVPDGEVGQQASRLFERPLKKTGWWHSVALSSHHASTSSRWSRAAKA